MGTHPKSTPPKATNKPMTMAGHDLPGTPSGFLSDKPILYRGISVLSGERQEIEEGKTQRGSDLNMGELIPCSTGGFALALYKDEARGDIWILG